MSSFVVIYSVPKFSCSATYIRKVMLTLFTFKQINDMIRTAIKWSFHYIKSLASVSPLKWEISFTDLHTSQERLVHL